MQQQLHLVNQPHQINMAAPQMAHFSMPHASASSAPSSSSGAPSIGATGTQQQFSAPASSSEFGAAESSTVAVHNIYPLYIYVLYAQNTTTTHY